MLRITSNGRLLGEHTADELGTQLICLASIHGNEQAGVEALKNVLYLLDTVCPLKKGRLVGLIGNLKALNEGKRFIHADLNRLWSVQQIEHAYQKPEEQRCAEENELVELHNCINKFIQEYNGPTILLDLHTTSANGGAFSIAPSHKTSKFMAANLCVPAISGVEKVLKTTIMSYFSQKQVPGIAFEAGQHLDPQSITITEAAIWMAMATNGMIDSSCKQSLHAQQTLVNASDKNMPPRLKFLYRHAVSDDHDFSMLPGFVNFMPVKKGQPLANNKDGIIKSPFDGLILMPLYQKQGEDGFFIVEMN
jgi:succinylglutamate desuccinylase